MLVNTDPCKRKSITHFTGETLVRSDMAHFGFPVDEM